MKRIFYCFTAVVVILLLNGCRSVSPYEYGTSWLFRENDIPQYYSKFDLFYLGKAPAGYGDTHAIQFNWTKTHTADIFGKGIRIFAPEIPAPTVQNVAEALDYYLKNFHKPGHPFILLAEGKAADLLYQAMLKTCGLTVENGFVAAYLPDMLAKTPEQITKDFYWENLKPAKQADDYGVIITWTSCINDEKLETDPLQHKSYNINPLNWKTTGTPATAKENIKAVFYLPERTNIFTRKIEVRHFCGAAIDTVRGVLEINCPSQFLHVANGQFSNNCISIFAGNIAANANLRTQTLIKVRQWGKEK